MAGSVLPAADAAKLNERSLFTGEGDALFRTGAVREANLSGRDRAQRKLKERDRPEGEAGQIEKWHGTASSVPEPSQEAEAPVEDLLIQDDMLNRLMHDPQAQVSTPPKLNSKETDAAQAVRPADLFDTIVGRFTDRILERLDSIRTSTGVTNVAETSITELRDHKKYVSDSVVYGFMSMIGVASESQVLVIDLTRVLDFESHQARNFMQRLARGLKKKHGKYDKIIFPVFFPGHWTVALFHADSSECEVWEPYNQDGRRSERFDRTMQLINELNDETKAFEGFNTQGCLGNLRFIEALKARTDHQTSGSGCAAFCCFYMLMRVFAGCTVAQVADNPQASPRDMDLFRNQLATWFDSVRTSEPPLKKRNTQSTHHDDLGRPRSPAVSDGIEAPKGAHTVSSEQGISISDEYSPPSAPDPVAASPASAGELYEPEGAGEEPDQVDEDLIRAAEQNAVNLGGKKSRGRAKTATPSSLSSSQGGLGDTQHSVSRLTDRYKSRRRPDDHAAPDTDSDAEDGFGHGHDGGGLLTIDDDDDDDDDDDRVDSARGNISAVQASAAILEKGVVYVAEQYCSECGPNDQRRAYNNRPKCCCPNWPFRKCHNVHHAAGKPCSKPVEPGKLTLARVACCKACSDWPGRHKKADSEEGRRELAEDRNLVELAKMVNHLEHHAGVSAESATRFPEVAAAARGLLWPAGKPAPERPTPPQCRACNALGHHARSCPKKRAGPKKSKKSKESKRRRMD